MNLKEATGRAGEALAAGDLEALRAALAARGQALAAGEAPTVEIFQAGEQLLSGLRELQQRAAYNSARLGQIRRYVEFRK